MLDTSAAEVVRIPAVIWRTIRDCGNCGGDACTDGEGRMEIVAENLSCGRGRTPVLAGLSFKIGAGECLEIVGPNGSGKSTLVRTLAGLCRPLGGELRRPDEGIAFLGHRNGIAARLTVDENLEFWAASGHSAVADAKRAFALERFSDRQARQLSAGQARRLAIATVLVAERPIWILDEPFDCLDAPNAERAASVVSMHCEAGGIAVVASHGNAGLPQAMTLDVSQFGADGPSRQADSALQQ